MHGHYDPMLAKVIAWAPTRAEAARPAGSRARRRAGPRAEHEPGPAGAGPAASGVPGRPHRHRLLRPARAGRARRGRSPDENAERLAALAAALARAAARPARRRGCWGGCRAGGGTSCPQPQRAAFAGDARRSHEVELPAHPGRPGCRWQRRTRRAGTGARRARGRRGTPAVRGRVVRRAGLCGLGGWAGVADGRCARFADPSAHVAAGSLLAPMPGTVTRVQWRAGDEVTPGSRCCGSRR